MSGIFQQARSFETNSSRPRESSRSVVDTTKSPRAIGPTCLIAARSTTAIGQKFVVSPTPAPFGGRGRRHARGIAYASSLAHFPGHAQRTATSGGVNAQG